VGLMPGLEEAPEAFHGAFLFRIPELTSQAHLAVLSSFPEGTTFEWDLKG
jgi:hypothetical protein